MADPPPPRVSRYRSARRAAQEPATSSTPELPSTNVADAVEAAVARSRSRYHKHPGKPAASTLPPTQPAAQLEQRAQTVYSANRTLKPTKSYDSFLAESIAVGSRSSESPSPRVPKLPSPPPPAIAPKSSFQQADRSRSRKVSEPSPPRPQTSSGSRYHSKSKARPTTAGGEGSPRHHGFVPPGYAESYSMLQAEALRQRQLSAKQREQQETKRLEDEAKRRQKAREEELVRKQDEQKAILRKKREKEEVRRKHEKEEEERIRAENAKAEQRAKKQAATQARDIPIENKDTSSIKEKRGFLRRLMGEDAPAIPVPPPPPLDSSAPVKDERPVTSAGNAPVGRSLAPPISRMDAPVSAVNHGDRRVKIMANGEAHLFTVKPTTTPMELMKSAPNFYQTKIDPRNSYMMEFFTKKSCYGLMRELRVYEHVRDILNTWDSDDQNILVLEPQGGGTSHELYEVGAPKARPNGGTWLMSFSQRRGKWEKQYVTLKPDGQITAAKNESGKGEINVCHLSDFDIFEVTKSSAKKDIKPPKKHTFAVKSNQKPNMFLRETGYIHFFSVNDGRVAKEFSDAVYNWRSWYLINVMGESTNASKASNAAAPQKPLLAAGGAHKRNASVESRYMLGSFNNGLDFDATNFEVALEEKKPSTLRRGEDAPLAAVFHVPVNGIGRGIPSAVEHSKLIHDRKMSIRRHMPNPPPVSSHHRTLSGASGAPTPTSSNFARDPSTSATSPASGLQRASSIRSTHRTSAASVNGVPKPALDFGKPLIDLTPQYVEPVQHQRRGKGFKADNFQGAALIEAATGPDLPPGAIVIPEARDWRPRGASVTGNAPPISLLNGSSRANGHVRQNPSGSGLQRNGSVRSTHGGRGLLGDVGGNEGFTGGGLLAAHAAKPGVVGAGNGNASGVLR